jgi:hypothetical protein
MTAVIYQGNEALRVDDAGRISRGLSGGSDSWRVLGAVTRNNFGAAVRYWTLAELLADPYGVPWHFKNGKQRTFLQDFDHGSRREWRSPSHRMGY